MMTAGKQKKSHDNTESHVMSCERSNPEDLNHY